VGTVIIVTAAQPGWVDESCALYMPHLWPLVHGIPTFARPSTAQPSGFKYGVFKRETKGYKNVISIGDGEPERMAALRLQQDLPLDSNEKHVKSIQLTTQPTGLQVVQEHELLRVRLADLVAFQDSLDLKVRAPSADNKSGSAVGCAMRPAGCTLMHHCATQHSKLAQQSKQQSAQQLPEELSRLPQPRETPTAMLLSRRTSRSTAPGRRASREPTVSTSIASESPAAGEFSLPPGGLAISALPLPNGRRSPPRQLPALLGQVASPAKMESQEKKAGLLKPIERRLPLTVTA
jgi:hypothetical protein